MIGHPAHEPENLPRPDAAMRPLGQASPRGATVDRAGRPSRAVVPFAVRVDAGSPEGVGAGAMREVLPEIATRATPLSLPLHPAGEE